MQVCNRGRRIIGCLAVLALCAASAVAQDNAGTNPVDFSHGPLKVSDNGRFLVHRDGTPFFWLADTAWELFHRLGREEAERYLENRRQKGFTVIQAVALAELDGLNTPNAYGDRPFWDNDPGRPAITPGSSLYDAEAYDYWDHVDWIIDRAAEKGMYIGLLPTWGDKVYAKWGIGPEVITIATAREYGLWIAERYRERPNIIWINGGDRAPVDGDRDNRVVWRELGEGIKTGDGNHLATYHPWGGTSSGDWFHGDLWLDFNMTQSGHAARNIPNDELVAKDYARTPVKPCLDGEPRYEDHAVDWDPENGWFDDRDVRQAAYWGVFAGGFGTTYGCHPVWQMYDEGLTPITHARSYWHEVLDLPGAQQMTLLKHLMLSRDFLSRVPDQSVIADGEREGKDHARATRGNGYLMVYLPTGRSVTIKGNSLPGVRFTGWWFNPRNGETIPIGTFRRTGGPYSFDPPGAEDRGYDWVLVLDDVDATYAAPGERN